MVDPSLIVAILALAGTLLNTAVTGWLASHSEKRKEAQEAQLIRIRFREPLFFSAQDLQATCWSILLENRDIEHESPPHKPIAVRSRDPFYVAYLFSHFLGWIMILREETMFIARSSTKETRDLIRFILTFQACMTQFFHCPVPGCDEKRSDWNHRVAFQLWRNQQEIIGGVMVKRSEEEKEAVGKCIDYHEFRKIVEDSESGLKDYVASLSVRQDVHEEWCGFSLRKRLTMVQHGLRDLMKLLDPTKQWTDQERNHYWPTKLEECQCGFCKSPDTVPMWWWMWIYRRHVLPVIKPLKQGLMEMLREIVIKDVPQEQGSDHCEIAANKMSDCS